MQNLGLNLGPKSRPLTWEGEEEMSLQHRSHHLPDQVNGDFAPCLPFSRLEEAVAVLSRCVDAVYTHMWVTDCYYAITDTHCGNGRVQTPKRTALVAHLDVEHQPCTSRDIEVGDCLGPLAASDVFPVGWMWRCIDNGMRITPM